MNWGRGHGVVVGIAGSLLASLLAVGGPAQGAETSAVERKPDSIASHLERGQAYLDKGEYAKAVLEFEQVLDYQFRYFDDTNRPRITRS